MLARDQSALFYDLIGTLRETKVFGFWGKYSCKVGSEHSLFTEPTGFLFENPHRRTCTWLQLDTGHQAMAALWFQANLQWDCRVTG